MSLRMRFLGLAVALGLGCGGAASKSSLPSADDGCEVAGTWELAMVWAGDELPLSCENVKAPWHTALGFRVTRGADQLMEVEPDSPWGGSAIEVTRVSEAACEVTVVAGTEGREDPDSVLTATFKINGPHGAGKVDFKHGGCVRKGSVAATRQ